MNITKFMGGVAMIAAISTGFASCSSELDSYNPSGSTKLLLNKAPKIQAYSGDYYWGKNGVVGTKAEDLVTAEFCETKLIDREHEKTIVEEYLPEKNENLELHPNLDSDFLFYAGKDLSLEFYPVYSQTTTANSLGLFYWDAAGHYYETIIWQDMNPSGLTRTDYSGYLDENNAWVPVVEEYSKGVKINVPKGCVFGFYWKGHVWKIGDYYATETVYYSDSKKNEESYCTDGGGAKLEPEKTSKVHAVTFQLEGKTYLGLEDWTDFDYQDWVFTCDEELITVDASTFVPGETIPDEGDKGNQGDDNGDDDDDDDNGDDNGDNNGGGTTTPGTPTTPEKPNTPAVGDDHTNEVEVNLGIDTKGETSGGKYNESHLSIHVRSAVDVDLFIPIPLDLVCPADDMEVVKKHLEGQMEHGGEFTNATVNEDGKVIMEGGLLSKMSYQIDQWTVSIYVEYVAAGTVSAHGETFAEEGIHIWTEGLEGNTELMEYLQENYGDGITFEIWNYFADESTLEQLKGYLDQTTIRFIGEILPDYFINAFGSENFEVDKDCTVSMVEEQAGQYDYVGTGTHLNASDKNEIYENKNHNNPEPPTKPEPRPEPK